MGGFLRLPALYKRKELPGSSDASAATPAEPVVKRPALAHPSAFQRAGDTIQVLKGPSCQGRYVCTPRSTNGLDRGPQGATATSPTPADAAAASAIGPPVRMPYDANKSWQS